jgi:hypothetical protein
MKQGTRINTIALTASLALALTATAGAQTEEHGRKWKPLPPTSHIVVTVVFHATRDGRNDGNLEVKTDPEGKATIDVIEIGSHLTVQVIANGFATSATEMDVDSANKELEVKLIRPRAQVSAYQDNNDKPAQVKPGIQEPPHPIPSPATPAPTTSSPQ